MSRRVALALAGFALAALTVTAPVAAEPPAPSGARDVKAMIERNKKCVRMLAAHASKVTYDRKDLEKYLAEWRSFEALDIDQVPDDAAEGPECVDLPAALANPKYVAWARERRLDPKDWLLKSLRISFTHAKRRAPAQTAEMKAQMETQRRELEKSCRSMGPNACREIQQSFASADEMLRETAAMMALFPDPTRAETALLDEYDVRIRQAVEESDSRDRPYGDDRDGGDEPSGGEAAGNEDAGDEAVEDEEK